MYTFYVFVESANILAIKYLIIIQYRGLFWRGMQNIAILNRNGMDLNSEVFIFAVFGNCTFPVK